MKQFTTAAKKAVEPDEEPVIPFELDGVKCIAYPPNEGQLALLVAAQSGSFADEGEQISTLINFTVALLDEATHTLIVRRLMDRDDDFELDNLLEVLEFIVEATAERPTKRSSASTSSQATDGASSTENSQVKELTPSV